ncbi:MAG: trigger factor [Selenomonadaceae bacterium]|nr:trigger factor [Selenomonadaceae bacterium]
MKVSAENKDKHQVALTIEVEAAEVEKAAVQACKRVGAKVSVPGFRKGKAPRKLLENHVGIDYIMQEAFEIIYPKVFQEALEQENLAPVTRPQVDIVTLKSGQDLVFKVEFTRSPEVTLGEYKGLNVPKEVKPVTDEDVEKQIKTFQERKAEIKDAPEDAVVEDGDLITLDFKGYVDGEAFEGGEGVDYPLQIGSKAFIPGFEDQLIGAKVGEARELHVTFPENYHTESLSGKAALFNSTVRSIKKRILPPLDDELAKAVSTFGTMEELRADVRKNLESGAQLKAENEQRTAVIDKATENATVDIPEVMIDNRVTHMIQELALRAEQRGMKLDQYLQYAGLDIARLRADYHETAAKNVKTDLVLDAIAKAEELKVDAKDLDAEVLELAAAYGTTPKQIQKIIKDNGQIGDLGRQALHKKTAQFIFDHIAG